MLVRNQGAKLQQRILENFLENEISPFKKGEKLVSQSFTDIIIDRV